MEEESSTVSWVRYPDNSPPGQFAPDNKPPRTFIHYQAQRAVKYMNPRLNVIQIILGSFIRYRTNYSLCFYPLLNLKILGELSGASCLTFVWLDLL